DALALRSRVAAARARRLERQRVQLLEDVGLLQAALLPVAPAQLGDVLTSAAYKPAAGPGAGGDFYDLFALEDGQLAVIVGDVSGHGRQALPHTALVRFTLRAYLEAGLSPRDAVQTAGAVLERQLAGVFATVLAATYDPARRLLTYACAGHPPPLIVTATDDAGGAARPPEQVTICAAPPIGIGMRTGTRQTVLSLPGRALLCFYTDGVTEARIDSELFGRERLVEELEALGAEAAAGELLDAVAARADARPDDMAACVLSTPGHAAAAEVLSEELELDREEAANPRTGRFLRACGLTAEQAQEAMRVAAAAAGRAGTAVLRLCYEHGRPRFELQRQQLAFLDPARIEAKALRGDAGAARGEAGVAR
ncbi:MAG TPA: SpoIIE family protein phosphatase, partial [Solirubrobacteraceae bacterium]|nr:SpoIIE family protein phosphatase [Solirubrobacteraceae bacterium]